MDVELQEWRCFAGKPVDCVVSKKQHNFKVFILLKGSKQGTPSCYHHCSVEDEIVSVICAGGGAGGLCVDKYGQGTYKS